MKFLVIFGVLFLTLFSYSAAEMIDDLEEDGSLEVEDLLSLMASEQTRKECTPRHHECTNDRHSCCRSTLFKDVCRCFYPEGEDKKEVCTCQQPKYLKYLEKGFSKAKSYVG